MDRIVWDTRIHGGAVTLIAQHPRMVEGNLIEWDLTDGDQTPYGTIRTGAHKDTVLAIHRRMARKAREYDPTQTAPAPAEAPKANTVRNPTGQQYKGRKYADRYAAELQESWGGEQYDGSFTEVVVDTLDTPEGLRYQVVCVTTPAPVAAPASTVHTVTQHNADTGETFTGTGDTVEAAVRAVVANGQASTQHRADETAWVGLVAIALQHTGATDRGFARYSLTTTSTTDTAPKGDTMDIRIGQVYRPTSGPAIAVAIVDYDGPGFYIVRNASGSGGTRSMSADALASYAHDPDAVAY